MLLILKIQISGIRKYCKIVSYLAENLDQEFSVSSFQECETFVSTILVFPFLQFKLICNCDFFHTTVTKRPWMI